MANQLQMAGSPGKPLKFVPIYTSRFFSGLWTHRSPLRSGPLGWQVEKYYGAHNDTLIDGLNTEISTRLTLVRRPGTSVYNNFDFPPILSFYSFRLFSTTSEAIKVIADTALTIYDATGPDTHEIIYEKTLPSPARFQSIGNILYFGDGDVTKKWIQSLNAWTPGTTFNINDYFIDANGNIQVFGDIAVFRTTTFFPIASTSRTGTTLKARYFTNGRGGNTPAVAGSVVSFSDLTVHTEINGSGVSGTVVSDLPVSASTRSFSELGTQSVADNILTVVVDFSAWPDAHPELMFPVGAVVSFKGTQDSSKGGGGVILSSSIDNPTFNATFTVVYVHPDYDPIPASITDLVVYYGDREITITTNTSDTYSDTQDTGFVCVGSTGSSLTTIASVSITDNIISVLSSGTWAVLMPYTKITFSGFTGATAFLNGTEATVLSASTTALTAVYYHTDLASTVATGGGRTIAEVATPQALNTAIVDVTITDGIAFFTGTNDFHVGDVVQFAGFATATEFNGTHQIISFSDGSFFHTHVPYADRVLTAEAASTAQELYGYLILKDGTITLTQPNTFSLGQSVTFSDYSIASYFNGRSFIVKTANANQYSGDFPDGTAEITAASVTTNVATITAKNQFSAGQFVTLQTDIPNDPTPPNNPFPTFAKVISATSTSFTIAATYSDFVSTPVIGKAFLFYTIMTDVGGKVATTPGTPGTGTTGTVAPNFNNLSGASIFEGNIEWMNHGSNLQNMGIVGPVLAPDVSLIPAVNLPPTFTWKARAYFGQANAGPITIVDNSGGGGPYIQEVIQSGITGGSQPVWNTTVGGTTTDGTVIWKNKGAIGRIQNHTYQIGDRIAVTYYVQVISGYTGSSGPGTGPGYPPYLRPTGDFSSGGFSGGQPIYKTVGPFSSYFTATKAGVTANVPSSAISWPNSPGQSVNDGTVTWKNTGSTTLWPGATVDLSTSGQGSIVDSNGNIQNVSVAGITGANPPAWATAQGATTVDGTVRWVNGGSSGSGATSEELPGKTYYGYAYKNGFTNEVSNMSPISNPVLLETGGAVSVQGIGPTDAQVDTIVIYRTLQGGSTFFWLAEISVESIVNGLWHYLDVSPDPPSPNSTMNLLIQAAVNLENTPPPHGATNWAFHLNRLWYSVGNLVGFSNPPGFSTGSSYTQFPPNSFFTFPSKVTRLWPVGTAGILVFTVSDIYIITGTTTLAFAPFPFLKGVGLSNYNALSIMGSIIMMHATDGQLISLDPNSGVTEVGFPIGDLIKDSFDPATDYVSWHVSGSEDKALYLADGSTGWHRLAPAAAPESGLIWNPFAEIVGGTSAVQSIEVSPGVFRLLIGS